MSSSESTQPPISRRLPFGRSAKQQTSATPSRHLWCGNVRPSFTAATIAQLFSSHPPSRIQIPRNPKTGQLVGYAFLTYETQEEAAAALATYDGNFITIQDPDGSIHAFKYKLSFSLTAPNYHRDSLTVPPRPLSAAPAAAAPTAAAAATTTHSAPVPAPVVGFTPDPATLTPATPLDLCLPLSPLTVPSLQSARSFINCPPRAFSMGESLQPSWMAWATESDSVSFQSPTMSFVPEQSLGPLSGFSEF